MSWAYYANCPPPCRHGFWMRLILFINHRKKFINGIAYWDWHDEQKRHSFSNVQQEKS